MRVTPAPRRKGPRYNFAVADQGVSADAIWHPSDDGDIEPARHRAECGGVWQGAPFERRRHNVRVEACLLGRGQT